jgi:hypothetical protein
MYIAVQERVIGAMLLQEEGGKEISVPYVSRRLHDAETWYAWRSRGKLMTENSDRLQVEGKPIPDNTNWLPRKTGPESGKTEPISGK